MGYRAGCSNSEDTDVSPDESGETEDTDGNPDESGETEDTDGNPDESGETEDIDGNPDESEETVVSAPTSQQAKLTADAGNGGDFFGGAVTLSDDGGTALIGASGDEDPNGSEAGSTYVFSQSNGGWQQQTKLTADDGDSYDRFGSSVSLSDDGGTALIGASGDEGPNGDRAGSAYVFSQSNGGWQQQAKLTADDGDSNDRFGRAVTLSGDGSTALIGAYRDEDPNGVGAGSAYVFSQSSGSWQQQAKLTADDGDSNDRFGRAVTLSGDGSTALIGARGDEDPNGDLAGSAYVFSQSNGNWQQQTKLTANDGDSVDVFGWAVTLSGDGSTALIGARGDEDPNGDQAGSAYVFSQSNGSWQQQTKLTADDGDSDDEFGFPATLSGDGSTAVIGARFDEDPNGVRAGSAYVFSQSSGSWQQQAKLTADDGDSNDCFGRAVTLSGDGSTALIGAFLDEDPNGRGGGSAYVFM